MLLPTISRTADSAARVTASSGSRFSNRKARASFSRYWTVKRMSTMFSSWVSIDESFSPVACVTALRPTSLERSWVTLTVSLRLERIREAPLEAGVDGVAVAAELGDDRLLAFLDDEDAAAEPDQRG